MAAAKSKAYPYQWPDGTWHSIPNATHAQHVAALAKPGSPAATAPDVYSGGEVPLPPDPGFEKARSGYEKTRDQTVTGLQGERDRGIIGYGYTVTPGVADPVTGIVGPTQAGAFDPNNPFSKASLLKKNYDVSRARTGNQMAAGGGLYSGAYQTAQDSLNRGQLQDENTLGQSLDEFLIRNAGQQAQAPIDYETNVGEIDTADRALKNPLYTPTAAAAPVAPTTPVAPKPPVKPAGGIGKATTKTSKGRPANQASSVGSTNKPKKPRVVTYTHGVRTP